MNITRFDISAAVKERIAAETKSITEAHRKLADIKDPIERIPLEGQIEDAQDLIESLETVGPGVWADIHYRPGHSQIKELQRQAIAAGPGQTPLDSLTRIVLTLTTAWSLKRADGTPIPISAEGIDDPETPAVVISVLATELTRIVRRTDPNLLGRVSPPPRNG